MVTPKQNDYNDNVSVPLLDGLKQKSLQHELTRLTIKVIVIVIGAWISLSIFEIFVAPTIGFQHTHIQVADTIVTIILALVIITAIRRILKRFSKRCQHSFLQAFHFLLS